MAEIAISYVFWSLKLCLCSMMLAKSGWLYSICGAKSALLLFMCRANLLQTWKGAIHTFSIKKGSIETICLKEFLKHI